MAQNIKIRDNTYNDCPAVKIPKSDTTGDAYFYDISAATLSTADQMLSGVIGHKSDGTPVTGNIASKSSSDLTVSGATVTVPAGNYSSAATKSVATGAVTSPATITGSSATVTAGTNTLTLSKTISVTPSVTTAGYVSEGTAGNSDVSLTASVTTKAAATYYPSTSDQSVSASQYLSGAQTIKAVLVSGLSAANVVYGQTIKVGDADDDDRITSVTGTAQIPVVSQDSTTKILSIS